MLKIRLRRTGRCRQPTYGIIVTEARSKRNGHYIESLGNWNQTTEKLTINKKRYYYWLERGAQPTLRVRKLCEKAR